MQDNPINPAHPADIKKGIQTQIHAQLVRKRKNLPGHNPQKPVITEKN